MGRLFTYLWYLGRRRNRVPPSEPTQRRPSQLQLLLKRLGLRSRPRSAPVRAPFRPRVEVLEDVNAPGNLLSTASVLPEQVAPNLPGMATVSAAADLRIDWGPFEADKAPSPLPSVPAPTQPEYPFSARSDDGMEKAPAPNATDTNTNRDDDPFLDSRLKPPAADRPNKDAETSREDDKGGGGDSSGGGGHVAGTVAGSAESSSASGGGASGGSASASQPAAQVNTAATQGAQLHTLAMLQSGPTGAVNTATAALVPPAVAATGTAPVPSAVAAAATAPPPSSAAAVQASPAPARGAPPPSAVAAIQPAATPGGSGGLIGIDPPIAAVEGTPFSGTVAEFTDPDGNTDPSLYSVQVSFGDGSPTTNLGGVSFVNGVFIVSSGHNYTEEMTGPLTVTTTVTDNADRNVTVVQSTATVSDAGLSASGMNNPNLQLSAGVPFSGVLASFQDADPAGVPADYTGSTIDWGDRTPLASATNTNTGNAPLLGGGHTYVQPGNYDIIVTAKDSGGASASTHLTAVVSSTLLSASPANPTLTEGSSGATTVATFTDQDGNTNTSNYQVQVSWGRQSSAGIVSYANGVFSVQASPPPGLDEGTYPLTVSINDTDQATAKVSGTAFVNDAALNATAAGPLTVAQGNSFSGTLATFTDANSAAPASDFSALVDFGDGSAPVRIPVSGSGGTYSVTLSSGHVWKQSGSATITVNILDDGGNRASVTATMTVTAPALPITVNPLTFTEGAAGSSITVATFTDPDNNTNPALYSATVAWGDGSSTPNATVSYSGGVFSVLVAAGHSYPEESSGGSNPPGTLPVSVSISDSDGARAVGWGTATVQDAALSGTATPVSAVAGTPFVGSVATLTDADPAGTAGDYQALINWGDGSIQTGGTLKAQGNSFQISGGHSYATPGNFIITITPTDAGGAVTTITTTATVAAPTQTLSTPAISAVENQAFSGNVSLFTPANPSLPASAYTAEIGWGDGGVSAGTLTSNGAGAFWISGGHTYTDESPAGAPYALTVTVVQTSSPATTAVNATGTATVSDASLSATALPAVTAFTGVSTGLVLLGRFSDAASGGSNPPGVGDFTANVSWGDNTSNSTGTVQVDPQGGFDVLAPHTFAAAGNFIVQATVMDDGGQTVVLSGTATVTAPTTSLTATEGISFSGTVATLTGSASQVMGATIDWGDGTSGPGTITDNGNGTFSVGGAHVYNEEGTYPLSVTVTLSGGGSLRAAGPATVQDALLSVVSAPLSLSGTLGDLLSASGPVLLAHFAEANPAAPLSDYTSNISWGDGASEAGTLEADPQGGVDVYGNHSYVAAGVFDAQVSLTDDGGATAEVSDTVSVILPEGQTYTLEQSVTLPTIMQQSPEAPYSVSIDWGDGSQSDGTVTPLTTEGAVTSVQVSAVHVYTEEGNRDSQGNLIPYQITATVSDDAGHSTAVHGQVAVGDANLEGYGDNFTTMVNEPYSGTVAQFVDDNAYATEQDFSAQSL